MKFVRLFACLSLFVVAHAWSDGNSHHQGITKAVAVLSPASGSSVQGIITFTQAEGGVKVVADLTGLTPGEHGFHIHQYGDCSAPDASSAGGHFNPEHAPHAAPDAPHRHAGDLGNITADAAGKAHYERLDKTLQLDGDESVIGHGVIVHANVDDLKTQPTGNAGGRVACGVIGVAKE